MLLKRSIIITICLRGNWLIENTFHTRDRSIATHGEIQLLPLPREIEIPIVGGQRL
jgi:hypothetical protein